MNTEVVTGRLQIDVARRKAEAERERRIRQAKVATKS